MLSYDELLANAAELTRGMERLAVELAAVAMDRNAHMERAERAVAELAAERERCVRAVEIEPECPGPQWRHKKRGSTYTEIGRARMQVDGPLDMVEVVIYQSNMDGSMWVRPASEFMDGRFERLATAAIRKGE